MWNVMNVMKNTRARIVVVATACALALTSAPIAIAAAAAQSPAPAQNTAPAQAQTPPGGVDVPAPPEATANASTAPNAANVSGAANASTANEPQPALLPEIPLLGRNGATVPGAAAFPLTGRWLLVVVRPNCAPCEALLARIQGDAWAPVIPRLVVITSGADAAEANRLATSFPALEAASWYADESARLAAALQIQESPVVLALHDRGIQWTLAGVLSGSKRMQDVLTAWVKTPADRRPPKPLPPVAER